MGRLSTLMATFTTLLFLFLFSANASIYRTTIVINDNEANPIPQSCQEQIRGQQNLRNCQEYVRRKSQSQETGWSRPSPGSPYQRDHQMCCSELRQLDRSCRCLGLEKAIEQQRQQGELQWRETRQAFQIARNLPSTCNVEPNQCQFRGSEWF